jgi:hypothetical protein
VAFKDELVEPWGLLIGATAAGAAWAVNLPLLAAGGVGAAVLLTKAGLAAWERRRREPQRRELQLPVEASAPEGIWLARAQRAAGTFSELAGGMAGGPLAERIELMRPQVDDTVETLERLAGQAGAAGRALARIDDRFLAAEAARLEQARGPSSGEIAGELDRSLASVRVQREVHGRLVAARGGVLARLESGTLGLESLVARVVELSAMAAAGPTSETGVVDQLSDELEGIRQGLGEAEEVSRQALNAYQRSKQ